MLLVIGLDGATLRLAGPWMDEGTLPNLARLRSRALWGTLTSTIPPATLPAWTTFMTGVNPGQHGIFDFTRRDPGSYQVRFVNSSFRKMPSVWKLLSEAGKRVAVLGMPGTYPPEPVNGVMVSGFDVPVATRADRSFVYPASMAEEIMRLGGLTFADFQEFHVGQRWYRRALSSLLNGIAAKAALARDLISREAWDCFSIVFGETDTVAHHFWHFLDTSSPRYDRQAAVQFGDAIRLVYRAVDEAVGEMLTSAPANAAVLLASDHGFGGTGDKAIHLNRWLHSQGWLEFAGASRPGVAGVARRAALRVVPPRWQAPLFRSFGGRVAGRIESQVRFAGIRWNGTRAFSEELNYFPSIWLNCEGREPGGCVTAGDYERTCASLADELSAWRDPETGRPIVRRVYHRSEVYRGPCAASAPDLILDFAEDEGFSYCCLPSAGRSGAAVRRLRPAEIVGGKRFGMSGSHRADGMFVLATNAEARGTKTEASIVDMAPSILALCGVSVPAWMEGRPLVDTRGVPLKEAPDRHQAEKPYSQADEAAIAERLRALGYLG